MKLEQCTKWELLKLVRSLPDQEEVKKKLSEAECDWELYVQRTQNCKPIATIYDARDFKGE